MEKHRFDHENDNVFEAVGVPKEKIKELDERVNELNSGEGVQRHSHIVEALSTEFTKEELALWVSAAARREIKREQREMLKEMFGMRERSPFGAPNPARDLAAMFAMMEVFGEGDKEDKDEEKEPKSFFEKMEEMHKKERD